MFEEENESKKKVGTRGLLALLTGWRNASCVREKAPTSSSVTDQGEEDGEDEREEGQLEVIGSGARVRTERNSPGSDVGKRLAYELLVTMRGFWSPHALSDLHCPSPCVGSAAASLRVSISLAPCFPCGST